MNAPSDYTEEDVLACRWIDQIRGGNAEGLDAFYALYHRPVFSLIVQVVGDRGAAEEILQDAFVRVFQQADRFNPELGSPFTWVATIGRRLAIDHLRKEHRRARILADGKEHPDGIVDSVGKDEFANRQSKPNGEWIHEFLNEVSDSQREIIELAFFQGFTHIEISERLEKPLGTVKSELRRGMMRLKKFYHQESDG